MNESVIALLVAAGDSTRMKTDMPKPYLQLGDEPLLRRTVKIFLEHPQISGVRVVIKREHHPYYKKAVDGLTLFPCVVGGATRQESVRRGLESIFHRNPTKILVHDIARPFTSHALISDIIAALDVHPAAIPGLAITDTVKRGSDMMVSETINRDQLFSIQTPQGFHFKPLLMAHQKFAGEELTDDAAIMEKAGVTVAIIPGDAGNTKLTTLRDYERMQTLLSIHSEIRTGIGFDVHQLKTHQPETPMSQQYIKLCGIKIPHTHYLVGHSDADVGLHAMVDSMLGAIGDGDIGMHFPPDDRKWQGADSERFLLYAFERIKNRGGELLHLDVTLICEKPKISEYRQKMNEHIAQMLKLTSDRVSIKATTTEKLGFTGRGEGIAAQAVATVRLPR